MALHTPPAPISYERMFMKKGKEETGIKISVFNNAYDSAYYLNVGLQELIKLSTQ